MNQLDLILKKNWDILIILDACRFDYFNKFAQKYFDEKPRKVVSPASNTLEWAKKVLEPRKWPDVVYVSANPFINSKRAVKGLDLRNNFYFIYDAWLYDWNEDYKTVMPDDLTKRALQLIEQYKDKKFIIHYIQPHAPYLEPKIGSSFFILGGNKVKPLIPFEKVRKLLSKIVMYYTPLPILQLYFKFENRRGANITNIELAFAKLGVEGLRKVYENNLHFALKAVRKLLNNIEDRRVVITADHGELLADRFLFGRKLGHPPYHHYPELIEVPWLEVII